MSKFVHLAVAVFAALAGSLVFAGVAEAGVGAGASPSFPEDGAIGGVRVGETYSAAIAMTNFNTPDNTADTNTVCNFGDTAPPCTPSTSNALEEDPGINLMLSCGLLGNDSICAPGGADPGVFQIVSAAVGLAGTACEGTTFTVSTTDTEFGTLRFEPDDGSNVQLVGQLDTCVIGFDYSVLRVPTIDSDPVTPGVQTIQITDNIQWSSVTNTNASARGTTPGITVLRALPSITTTASAAVALGAGTITDSAVVSGRVNPVAGATVTFTLYGPDDVACTGAPVFTSEVAQGTAGGAVTSEPYAPTAVGTYRWIASYSGDANNEPVSGSCNDANESVVASPGQPTLSTTASATVRLGAGDLTDTATVSGRVGALASTVSFSLFGPDDDTCAGPAIFTDIDVDLAVTDDSVTSAAYTPTVPGTYRWIATYSGDANNLPAQGACNDDGESVVVDKAQPILTTDAGPDVTIGDEVTDTATVTGRVTPGDATLDFRLFGPDDNDCSGDAVFEQLGVPFGASHDDTVTSNGFTPAAAGTYRWVVAYSGDDNNEGAVGVCGDPAETVVVAAIPVVELPATGTATRVLMGSGGALLLVGLALVGLGRRPRLAR